MPTYVLLPSAPCAIEPPPTLRLVAPLPVILAPHAPVTPPSAPPDVAAIVVQLRCAGAPAGILDDIDRFAQLAAVLGVPAARGMLDGARAWCDAHGHVAMHDALAKF